MTLVAARRSYFFNVKLDNFCKERQQTDFQKWVQNVEEQRRRTRTKCRNGTRLKYSLFFIGVYILDELDAV